MFLREAERKGLETEVREGRVLWDAPVSGWTSFRIGGPADALILPSGLEETVRVIGFCREKGIPYWVIGAGTNLLVSDEGLRGALIVLGEGLSRVEREGEELTAEAGAKLTRLSQAALAAGLSGLEFAAGIPGTVGGGVIMNAGAYGGEIADVCQWADVLLPDGSVSRQGREELAFGYRSSAPQRDGLTVLRAMFRLRPGNAEEIAAAMQEYNRRRREKQPLELPSAGSTFRRPEGYYAGALIEQAGCKGLTVGGACVSPKHAGFIVNIGGATAADVLALIGEVQRRVLEQSGVLLEPEVRFLGMEDGR